VVRCLDREHDVPSLEVPAKQQECLPQGLHKYYLVLRSLPAPFFFFLSSALITQKFSSLIKMFLWMDGHEKGNSKEPGQEYTDKDGEWPL